MLELAGVYTTAKIVQARKIAGSGSLLKLRDYPLSVCFDHVKNGLVFGTHCLAAAFRRVVLRLHSADCS